MNNMKKHTLLIIILVMVAFSILQSLNGVYQSRMRTEKTYTQFLDAVENNEVQSAVINLDERTIDYETNSGMGWMNG